VLRQTERSVWMFDTTRFASATSRVIGQARPVREKKSLYGSTRTTAVLAGT